MSAPKRCGNCRFYDGSDNGARLWADENGVHRQTDIGICERIPDANDLTGAPIPAGEAASYDFESYSSGLYVHVAFGCVLHEAADSGESAQPSRAGDR